MLFLAASATATVGMLDTYGAFLVFFEDNIDSHVLWSCRSHTKPKRIDTHTHTHSCSHPPHHTHLKALMQVSTNAIGLLSIGTAPLTSRNCYISELFPPFESTICSII